MEHSKSGLYIVAIVGVVAIVAIVLFVISGSKEKVLSSEVNTADLAGKSYDLGYCHYEDGSSTGCPCSNPSDGVISTGAKLISSNC